MRRTPYVLAAATALLLMTGPARAGSCPGLTDPVGDAGPGGIPLPVALSHTLDIVSADVVSGPTTVVAVLRVRELRLEPAAAELPAWSLRWFVAGTEYSVGATYEPDPVVHGYRGRFSAGWSLVDVPVAVDTAGGTFTWTLPRSWFPELATPGAAIGGLHASAREVLTYTADYAGDYHGRAVTHVDGTAGCVPAA